jgi:protein-S-isoprenylcysteine O-methyltransferase Ste14
LPVVLVGEGLRVWSSGTLEKNVAIADAGPYAYTRNPLYVGNFLIGLGFVVMGHNGWLAGMFLALFPLVYIPTILEEERFLRAKFGDVYEAYLRRVPRFLPSFSAAPRPSRFRWELVKFHRELQTWYALCAGFTAVVIKAVWTP